MMVFATSTVCWRSHNTRYGLNGASLLVSFGIHFASHSLCEAAISAATAEASRSVVTVLPISSSSASSTRAASPTRPIFASTSLLR